MALGGGYAMARHRLALVKCCFTIHERDGHLVNPGSAE